VPGIRRGVYSHQYNDFSCSFIARNSQRNSTINSELCTLFSEVILRNVLRQWEAGRVMRATVIVQWHHNSNTSSMIYWWGRDEDDNKENTVIPVITVLTMAERQMILINNKISLLVRPVNCYNVRQRSRKRPGSLCKRCSEELIWWYLQTSHNGFTCIVC